MSAASLSKIHSAPKSFDGMKMEYGERLSIDITEINLYLYFVCPNINIVDFISTEFTNADGFSCQFISGVGSFIKFSSEEESNRALNMYSKHFEVMRLLDYLRRFNKVRTDKLDAKDVKTEKLTAKDVSPAILDLQSKEEEETKTPKRTNFIDKVADNYFILKLLGLVKTTQSSPKITAWNILSTLWKVEINHFKADHLRWFCLLNDQDLTNVLLNLCLYDLTNKEEDIDYHLRRLARRPKLLCVKFLAGVCRSDTCPYIHPCGTAGWNLLEKKWNITYLDFTPKVLIYLSQLTFTKQERILKLLSSMDLQQVNVSDLQLAVFTSL